MGRYVDDIAAAGTGVQDSLWARALARAQTATTLITTGLARETALAPGFPAEPLAARLDRYATVLTYGRTCCTPTWPALPMASSRPCRTGRR